MESRTRAMVIAALGVVLVTALAVMPHPTSGKPGFVRRGTPARAGASPESATPATHPAEPVGLFQEPQTARVVVRLVGPGASILAGAHVSYVTHRDGLFLTRSAEDKPEDAPHIEGPTSQESLDADENGRFELKAQHREHVTIVARSGELVTAAPVRFDLKSEETREITIELTPGGAIVGQVTAPPGRFPVGPPVFVNFVAEGAAEHADLLDPDVECRPDGSYQAVGLAPGRYRVGVGGAAGREVEVRAGARTVVDFSLMDAVDSIVVRLVGAPADVEVRSWATWDGTPGERSGASTAAATSGVATLENVRAGEVQVHVRAISPAPRGAFDDDDAPAPWIELARRVTVAHGQPAAVDFDWPASGGTIAGKCAAKPEPEAGDDVVRWAHATSEGCTAAAPVDEELGFKLGHLLAGHYRVVVNERESGPVDFKNAAEVVVEEGRVVTVSDVPVLLGGH